MENIAGPKPWSAELAEQLSWHWEAQLRPRLEGLTDAEYLWEPVPGAWNVHPEATGRERIDFSYPPPEPTPLTTIAWRLAHVVVGVFGDRNARYFGGPPTDYDSYSYPGTAAESLADLDAAYARWIAGVRALDDAGLAALCAEPGHESDSMAALVLHIHREVIHHGAEVALIRDLWANAGGAVSFSP